MKLIDVDNFKKNNPEYLKLDIDYVTEVTVEDVLDCEPTVEAIPVEWILHYVDTHYNVDNFDDIWRYIMKMHDEWEKENASITD